MNDFEENFDKLKGLEQDNAIESPRFKDMDFEHAVEKLADSLVKFKSEPEKLYDAYLDRATELYQHYGKCKTSDLDSQMVKKALEQRGIDCNLLKTMNKNKTSAQKQKTQNDYGQEEMTRTRKQRRWQN